MLAAAFSFAFHRFLHVGQFTTSTGSTFNPTIHMSPGDISWHLTQPRLKKSKTDEAGRGTIVLLPRTADASCPTAQCYDTGRIPPLPVLPGHPSSNSQMATHCPVWSADGTFTGFSIRVDIPSCLVQHTQFSHWDCNHHCHHCQCYLQ